MTDRDKKVKQLQYLIYNDTSYLPKQHKEYQ